jgi:hypothetical protein
MPGWDVAHFSTLFHYCNSVATSVNALREAKVTRLGAVDIISTTRLVGIGAKGAAV